MTKKNIIKGLWVVSAVATLLVGSVFTVDYFQKQHERSVLQTAATDGVDTLRMLLRGGGDTSLGFAIRAANINDLRLGGEIGVFYVGLAELTHYREGTEKELIGRVIQHIYRIVYNDKIFTSERIEWNSENKKWEVISYGDSILVAAVDKFNTHPYFADGSQYLITIPAFQLDFLAGKHDGETHVVLLNEQPFDEINPGSPMTLGSMFKKLKPVAAETTVL